MKPTFICLLSHLVGARACPCRVCFVKGIPQLRVIGRPEGHATLQGEAVWDLPAPVTWEVVICPQREPASLLLLPLPSLVWRWTGMDLGLGVREWEL